MKSLSDFEQQIHEALDAKDPDTLEQYAEHCMENMDSELMLELFKAIVRDDETLDRIAVLRIWGRVDKQRAEFVAFEAQRRSKADDEHQLYLAELDRDFRGAA